MDRPSGRVSQIPGRPIRAAPCLILALAGWAGAAGGCLLATGRLRRTCQQLHELLQIHRLHQVAVDAGAPRAALVGLLAPACEGDQFRPPASRLGADAPRHLVAIQTWHADVQQRDIRLMHLGSVQRLPRVAHGVHRVPSRLSTSARLWSVSALSSAARTVRGAGAL
jgi:hypothetical protein